MPWDDVAIGGGVVVSALISILKRFFGLREPWIGRITWLAGFAWLTLARVAGGEDWIRAGIGAFVVVAGAAGFYERVSKPAADLAGKVSSRS